MHYSFLVLAILLLPLCALVFPAQPALSVTRRSDVTTNQRLDRRDRAAPPLIEKCRIVNGVHICTSQPAPEPWTERDVCDQMWRMVCGDPTTFALRLYVLYIAVMLVLMLYVSVFG
ncbi:hypothetical protein GGR53DRAFT_463328 [Hypoxylon sp. FL1150]|nr:hypothetical protein GGR53DRAFT_463328 [Hypoxylon sp. FL1150]